MAALVSIIIPTYNRYDFLQNAIASVTCQIYPNIEIIVVKDGSIDTRYKSHHHQSDGVNMIHLEKNTKSMLGHTCSALVRNTGIDAARGEYVAFLDDDDVWLPIKLQTQMDSMIAAGALASCSDAYIGKGVYNPMHAYKVYNKEHYWNTIQTKYREHGYELSQLPQNWTSEFLDVHNCIITSSVIVQRELMLSIGSFPVVPNGREDYDCWLRLLRFRDILYVDKPLLYYDMGHGEGQNYTF